MRNPSTAQRHIPARISCCLPSYDFSLTRLIRYENGLTPPAHSIKPCALNCCGLPAGGPASFASGSSTRQIEEHFERRLAARPAPDPLSATKQHLPRGSIEITFDTSRI